MKEQKLLEMTRRSNWTYLFLEVEETKAKMLVLRHAYPY